MNASSPPTGEAPAPQSSGPVPPERPDPPTPPPRLLILDVLRGVAILGTLAMNIHFFAHWTGEGNRWVEDARTVFVNGSFFSLLALMFGVGLAVQFRAARASGRRWPGRHPWRAVLLLLEGALHVVLVFALDVLMGYAVTALLVIWLLGRSERVRSAVMWTALGVHLVLSTTTTVLMAVLGSRTRELSAREQAVDDAFTALYRDGAYPDQVADRFTNFLATRSEIIFSFPLLVFLFLLGVRLYRAGVFDDSDTGRRFRGRMTLWGFGIGLPLNILASQLFAFEMMARYVFPVVLVLGYIGLTGRLLERVRPNGQVVRSLRSVGRAALSCYILQNVAASWLFYGWGMGLSRYLEDQGTKGLALDAWILGGWLGIALLLVVGSRAWLHRFDRGPLETVGARLVSLVPERRSDPERTP